MSTKDILLQHLEKSKGAPVSGEAMAAKLGLTRAAVWKAVKALQDEGWLIQPVHKRGYVLSPGSDRLSPHVILPHLHNPELWPDIRVLPSCPSTNALGKELALAGAPSGTVLIAEAQTAGKGRLGRSFASPPGAGVYLSVILRLTEPVETSLLVTSMAAVAVCRAIREVAGLETQIKWVNDIFYNGGKLCGILTEAAMDFESQTLDYLVLGIGVNVLESPLPPEVAAVATSLERALGGQRISRVPLAIAILNELGDLLGSLAERGFLSEYRARSLLPGHMVDIISPAGRERGMAVEIDDQARLVVQMETGERRALGSGEVSVRPTQEA